MKNKRGIRCWVIILLFVLAFCLALSGCQNGTTGSGSAGQSNNSVKTEVAELPDGDWQIDVSFPDWKGWVSSNLAANNRIGFTMYSGQGELYITNDGDCDGFSLYVNDKKIDVDLPSNGETVKVDISSLTRNEGNTIQVSDIENGSLRVSIPYPTVIDGTPEEVGIKEESLNLIDKIITADIDHGFASAQLAVIKDGRLVYEKSWGNVRTYNEKAEPVESKAVDSETLYDLASNTKMYSVNYAIQYLVTTEGLDLDTKIVDILGKEFSEDTIKIDYEGREAVDLATHKKWKSELTLRHLLMHQGGFPPGPHYYSDRYNHVNQDFDSDAGNVIYVGTKGDEKTREETLKGIFKTPLMYEPGTDNEYSDVDYMLLCYCIEKITGKGMEEYLKEIFWEPMGLTKICYNPLKNGFTEGDCAATELVGNTRADRLHYSGIRTYTLQGEVHDPNAFYCMSGVSGHAGLFASATDLAKLATVMLTGGYGEHQYFSRDVIDAFTTPSSEDATYYGLGWWVEADHNWDTYFTSVGTPSTFGHQGFTGTLTMIDPDNNLVVVFLTNKIHGDMLPNDETLGRYNGNYYTTGALGFVPQILEIGLKGEADKDIYKSLVSDMVKDKARDLEEDEVTDPEHPEMKAYEALCQVLDSM